jgi:serine/threonine protein kinase
METKLADDLIQMVSKMKLSSPSIQSVPGFPMIKFETISRLGAGGFGQVKKVKFTEPAQKFLGLEDKEYALKMITSTSEEQRNKRLNEIYIIKRIQDETGCLEEVLCFYATRYSPLVDSKGTIYAIYELMDGDLFDLFSLPLDEKIQLVNQVIYPSVKKGLEYLHGLGLIHRDIKPENILYQMVDNKIKVKIADFGLGCTLLFYKDKIYDPKCENCKTCDDKILGTLSYIDPKHFTNYIKQNHSKWTIDSDMYALAITISEFLLGHHFTNGQSYYDIAKKSIKTMQTDRHGLQTYYRSLVKKDFQQIIDQMPIWLDQGLDPKISKFILEYTSEYF